MLLSVRHRTEYRYDAPVFFAMQRLRLWPCGGRHQRVGRWSVRVEGAVEQARLSDAHGNDLRLYAVEGGAEALTIDVEGEVETLIENGVLGAHEGPPLWLYLRETSLSVADPPVRELATVVDEGGTLASLHALSSRIREAVTYEVGATGPTTTASDALRLGRGVCQDHAHLFCAAARSRGVPARYVSGYLKMNDREHQDATHAWAEAHVDGLGWVGFDVSNGYSPDGRYVRLATGLDYRDAAPVSGILSAERTETLRVSLSVIQRQAQQ